MLLSKTAHTRSSLHNILNLITSLRSQSYTTIINVYSTIQLSYFPGIPAVPTSHFQVLSSHCFNHVTIRRRVNCVHFNFRWQSSTRSYLQIAAHEGTLQSTPDSLEIRRGDEKMSGIQVRWMRRKRKQFSVTESLHGGMRRYMRDAIIIKLWCLCLLNFFFHSVAGV